MFDLKKLSTIENDIKLSLVNHIKKNKTTPTTFAKEVGIHPYQMLRFVNRGKGLNLATLKKIGDYINSQKKK